jgi:hypothetical protein
LVPPATVTQVTPKVPHTPVADSVASRRWSRPVDGLMPEPPSVPVAKVTGSEAVVTYPFV